MPPRGLPTLVVLRPVAPSSVAPLSYLLTLVGGQKYAFFGLPSLTLAGQNVLLPANIREGGAVGCQT